MELIKEKLRLLKERDIHFEVFGSEEHRYRLSKCLEIDNFSAIENKHNCVFPKDYKTFITKIGNGGAGPGLGLFPIEKKDSYSWSDGWTDESLDSWSGFISDLSKPFLLTEGLNAIENFWNNLANKLGINLSEISEEEDTVLYRKYKKDLFEYVDSVYSSQNLMQGAIPICHIGCGKYYWLIVSGPQKGYVWLDLRCNDQGVFPCLNNFSQPMAFYDWYFNWLVESLAEMDSMRK